MFNSFHLHPECCPNYIILISSLPCFNRSVVAIIPLLTRVLFKCFHLAKFILSPAISNRSVVVIDPYHSLYISFHPECLHVLLAHCNPFLMSFNHRVLVMVLVPLSSWSVFNFDHLLCILFSKLFNLSRFFGITRLYKSNSVLPLPLSFLSGAIPRSRDEISCKWRSVVTPQDRRSRCLPWIPRFVV